MTQVRPLIAAALLALAFPTFAAAKPADRDRDRMPDRWERKHKLSVKSNDAARDPDRDGLRNVGEYRAGSNPRKPDSDRDGTLDGHEDRDRDSVDNGNEERERTHPRKKDTDRDGVRDGKEDPDRDGLDNHGEDVTGNDPIDPDTDDDGVKDGAEDAGTIESFVDGVLTVRSVRGGSVTGLVTDETEIACKSEDELEWWDEDEELWDEEDDELAVRSSHYEGDGEDEEPVVKDDDEPKGDDSKDESGDEWDWDESDSAEFCGVDELVPGAAVHEAELAITADGPVFTKIKLVE